ncbi:YrzA family protein [Metabacillus arenae]|uniref:YrzA family protein n=1 Tax=Metabacillus arenae TaxID=2771434 RepID=A0A926ND48_9BACI|nr:YrzA family protein [Metabacillus arenae]MBD1382057.1 YrzA family protein [Metabacillus arenae]
MNFQLDFIKDKVEFFEAETLKDLERKINEQIENNKAILLEVHSVSHQMHVSVEGRRFYSAVVHFKAK